MCKICWIQMKIKYFMFVFIFKLKLTHFLHWNHVDYRNKWIKATIKIKNATTYFRN